MKNLKKVEYPEAVDGRLSYVEHPLNAYALVKRWHKIMMEDLHEITINNYKGKCKLYARSVVGV